MKGFKTTSLCLAVVIGFALSMAGCGTKKADVETGSASTAKAAQSTAVQAEPAKEVKMKIFHHISEEAGQKFYEELTSEYTKKNPNVTFDIEVSSFDNYYTMLKTKMAAGDTPDIFIIDPKGQVEIVKSGNVMDVSGFKALKKVPSYEQCKLDGKAYAIPTDAGYGVMGYFYNKDIFTQAGITDVPKSPAEFLTMLKTIKDKGIEPLAAGYADGWTSQVEFQNDFYEALSKQPTFYEDIMAGKLKFSQSEVFKSSLLRIRDRLQYLSNDPYGTDYAKSLDMFAGGKAAMLSQGTWAVSEIIKRNPKINMGFFGAPVSDKQEENVISVGGSGGFGVSANTQNPEVADDLFDMLWTVEMQQKYVDMNKSFSVLKGVKNSQPVYDDISKYFSENRIIDNTAIKPFTGEYDKVFRQLQEEFIAKNCKKSDKNFDIDAWIKHCDDAFSKISN